MAWLSGGRHRCDLCLARRLRRTIRVRTEAASTPASGSGDQAFRALAQQAIDDHLRRNPSAATDLGRGFSGFHADDPSYRLAQLQDALLRDVRFIVGIKLHTQGMTVEEATSLFETQGHQPHPVALSDAKRGTADALYGYYTMGKLMILKLREDYKGKVGSSHTVQGFHDAFIKLGPLPMPLIRRAMLGEAGEPF
jgi:uncharacterized protein (DUF885 family)